jgi:hypothetical protein
MLHFVKLELRLHELTEANQICADTFIVSKAVQFSFSFWSHWFQGILTVKQWGRVDRYL